MRKYSSGVGKLGVPDGLIRAYRILRHPYQRKLKGKDRRFKCETAFHTEKNAVFLNVLPPLLFFKNTITK